MYIIANEDYQCRLKKYIHGVVVSDVFPDKQFHDEIYRYAREINYNDLKTDIPKLPDMDLWVNAKEVGLSGDGITDDTESLKKAIEKYQVIYFPQGEYILSDTIKLAENTVFIASTPSGILSLSGFIIVYNFLTLEFISIKASSDALA